ncbi:S41 family peptidase [Winogradskyella ouciana]|nr:S41 family peptidase [Winogradskyella ouciana]
MMKKFSLIALLCAFTFVLTGCFEDLDDNAIANSDINDFVWKGMNAYYLYNSPDQVPDLSNDRFGINGIDDRYEKTEEYSEYLNGFATPEDLFETLIFEPLDPFSVIVPNYLDIINAQQGTTLSNGIEFRLYLVPGSQTEVFGAITLVLNNSVADNLGLVRGQVFRAVDGTDLTTSNINTLLGQDSYTLNFADYDNNGTPQADDDTITLNGESTDLTKAAYTENPVHIAQVLNLTNVNVGYLMYNGFSSNFDNELNDAFGQFQAAGVQELVIDLRYNGGGNIQTAVHLASMVTGQFNGQVFSKLFYNNNQQSQNRNYEFTNALSDNTSINSLNLNKVYVLTSSSSASASELIINSLRPYIEVVHIGDMTAGKTQANRLVFDSQEFDGNNVNGNHNYALIPLIANSTNVNDGLVPTNGLTPDVNIVETPSTFGTLGMISEPLLAAAIADITNGDRSFNRNIDFPILEEISAKELKSPIENLMFED